MRATSINTVQYQPGQVPNDPAEYQRYLREEFDKIAAVVMLLAEGNFEMVFAEPAKKRMGQRVLADGTSWNPGSGRGAYWYDADSNTWNFMG